MLVLSRKVSEALQLGPNITVKIISIDGNRVRIGIEAPDEVRVTRVGAGEERRKAFAEAVGKTEKLREVGRVQS